MKTEGGAPSGILGGHPIDIGGTDEISTDRPFAVIVVFGEGQAKRIGEILDVEDLQRATRGTLGRPTDPGFHEQRFICGRRNTRCIELIVPLTALGIIGDDLASCCLNDCQITEGILAERPLGQCL